MPQVTSTRRSNSGVLLFDPRDSIAVHCQICSLTLYSYVQREHNGDQARCSAFAIILVHTTLGIIRLLIETRLKVLLI